MTEWWTTQTGTLIGALGGGGLGALGGMLGACAGVLAPRGRGRAFVLGSMMAMAALGLVLLIAGIVAVVGGQPHHVYYPLLLIGAVLTLVIGPLIPVVRLRYAQAEQRRLEAQSLRHA
jgi:MFS family permease